jgi:hypothetical protein
LKKSHQGQTGCGKRPILGNFDEEHPSGAEAHIDFKRFAARLKSCPDTIQSLKIILQAAQKSTCIPKML